MVFVPVSIGELLDKISILQIKSEKTENDSVHKELSDLIEIAKKNNIYSDLYLKKLLSINRELWDIEDKLRRLEKISKFDDEFVDLARKVYIKNDKRSEIKKMINIETNSQYKEVKIY